MNGKMDLKNKLNIFSSIVNSYFGKKTPLSVSWTLLNRCNRKCLYCDLPNIKSNELSKKQIFSIIDELSELGCQRIGFTGGEPFLRKDIKEIIKYTKSKGIFIGVVSNGSLVTKNNVKEVDLLQLSLDGDKEINDNQRYNGSFNDVVKAIKIAKKKNIKTWITYTITKYNLDTSFILDLAQEYNLRIFFQPVVYYKNCGLNAKNSFPDEVEFRKTINNLIKLKKKQNNFIGNSLTGLRYFYNWPNYKFIKCYAGNLFAHIYPNGDIFPCFNMDKKQKKNCLNNGFKKPFYSFNNLDCDGCWTYANIELNLLLNLNLNAVFNTLNLMK